MATPSPSDAPWHRWRVMWRDVTTHWRFKVTRKGRRIKILLAHSGKVKWRVFVEIVHKLRQYVVSKATARGAGWERTACLVSLWLKGCISLEQKLGRTLNRSRLQLLSSKHCFTVVQRVAFSVLSSFRSDVLNSTTHLPSHPRRCVVAWRFAAQLTGACDKCWGKCADWELEQAVFR